MLWSVLVRRLKEGMTFEQSREAWVAEPGHFGMAVRVVHARRTDDEREILSFSFLDIDTEEVSAAGQIAEGEKRRHDRISEVIGATVMSGIYEVITEVDLS